MKSNTLPSPPSIAKQLVKYIIGFGVSVGIGLAPYLGKIEIPFFDSLLKLIPNSLHNSVLPLSAALMGLVSVVIQWYGNESDNKDWLSKAFFRTLTLTFASFLILFIIHVFVVVSVPYEGGSETFLIGFVRPIKPPCGVEISDLECIRRITLSDAAIQSFWGSFQIRVATLALVLPYLVFTGSFGLLVGLLLLRDKLIQKK